MNAKWLPGARTTALVSTLTTLLMAAGCAHFSATGQSSPNQASKLPLTASTLGELKGEQVIQTTAGQWLAVSPDSGVQISDAQTAPNQLANIQSEYLDAKTSTKTGVKETHLLTLTTDNQLALLTLNSGSKLTTQALSSALPWSVEGLCLYQPVSSHALQAFVLDDNGMGHQMLLHSNGHQLNAREIRQLPLPPAAEYCTVDDQADRLYVSEEGIGLWVYNARAESELSRQVIDMVAPWGQMESTPGPMAIIDGELLMAEVSSNRIHRYQLTEDGAHRIGELTVAQAEMTSSESELAIESLFAGTGLEGQWLAFYDDESGELFTASLNSVEILADQRAIDIIPEIPASAETTPVSTAGDAADDPAIWVNPNDASKSLILGTNKKRALVVYDLKGNKVQDLPVGRVNNVDVRQGFALKGQPMDIAAASHRDHASVMLFAIDPTTGQISEAGEVATTLDDVYGFCLYQSKTGLYAFINDQDGRYEQYRISDSSNGWKGEKVREFAVATQPEGCAADDRHQRLFVGEEGTAVWTLGAEPDASTDMTMLAPISDVLHADIEGMDLYNTADGGYLVVSSQGNDSYAVYNSLPPFEYKGRFRVGLNAELGIDGASETDGLTVTSLPLGPDYPEGLLVVQDGRNLLPNDTQNFKLIDWHLLKARLQLEDK